MRAAPRIRGDIDIVFMFDDVNSLRSRDERNSNKCC
jgi:hypothetical protein